MNSIADWNLQGKAERDAIDFSKVRELQRESDGYLKLYGKRVEVLPCCKPEFISSSGYATMYFKGEEDIKRGVYVNIEKRCSELCADCYEVGPNLITWSSDPGFGSRRENYVVQFYKLDNRLEKIKAELSFSQDVLHATNRARTEERIARDGGFRSY